MALTNAQLQTIKTAINAETDPEFVGYRTSGATGQMSDWYNTATNPAFVVWRTSVSKEDIQSNPTYDWTRVDNLSVGKARIWDQMFYTGSINPSQPNVRTGIDSTWVGTQADLNVRASVYTKCKRPATRAEKLYATGTGTDATPATMTFEGSIYDQDIIQAINS